MSRYLHIMIGLALLIHAIMLADDGSSAPDYIRFEEGVKGAQLQTAVTRFVNKSGVGIDLIGAVHIADKAYYDALNARFGVYDVVLYELVGGEFNERAKVRQGTDAGKMKWLGIFQQQMKDALGLTGQMEGIDYDAPNFVHADMGMGEFLGAQNQRGETFLGLWMKAWKAQVSVGKEGRKFDQPGLAKVLEILCRKDSSTELKRLVGREFDQVEALMEGIESEGGTVIVGERNRLVLLVLEREIAIGKKRIGIFYGAAHMPDMETRLLAKGFLKQTTDWLSAWNLPPEVKEGN